MVLENKAAHSAIINYPKIMKISTNSRSDFFVHIGLVLALLITLFLGFFFVYLPFSTNHGQSITVPDLSGMDMDKLEDYLDERNLRYEISDCTFVADKKPFTVLRQYPKPGMVVKEGRKVYVYIASLNAPNIKMPQLVDRTFRSAQLELKRVGLQMGKLIYVNDMAQFSVIRQLFNGQPITAGQLIPQGSKIDLEVANGIGNTEMDVPDVMNKTIDEAEFILTGSHLKWFKIYIEDATEAPGTVIFQNPEAGSGMKIRQGETIDIKVAGPDPKAKSQDPPNPQ
jgi:eukaryotic-like serine/threonine-protein kinase